MGKESQLEVGQTYLLQEPPAKGPLPGYLYAGMRVKLVWIGDISLFVESPFHQILAVPHGSLALPDNQPEMTQPAPPRR